MQRMPGGSRAPSRPQPPPPARPARGVASLLAGARYELVPLPEAEDEVGCLAEGSTVTISCSPRTGIDATVALGERLAARGFRPVPHMAARTVRDSAHLQDVVDRMVAAGVSDVFVVGGDSVLPLGCYRSALDLLEAIAELGHPFSEVGIAGYPEPHPLVDGEELDRALRAKEPLATYVVTQMCFDAGVIVRWLRHIRQQGIALPVHLGMPGVLDRRRLLDIARRVGVGDSIRYLSRQHHLTAQLLRHRHYRPDRILAGLAPWLADTDLNVGGLHINSFNQVRRTERWRRRVLAGHGSPLTG